MSTAYKNDEKALHDIIARNCTACDPQNRIKLVIYYQCPQTSDLIMRNNISKDSSPLKATNIVYEFKCTTGDCARRSNSAYVGFTITSLSRRLTMHLQSGAPKEHMKMCHGIDLTRNYLVENTSILATCHIPNKLRVLEAVYIRSRDPVINRQMNMRGTLSLFDSELTDLPPLEVWKELLACDVLCTNEKTSELYVTIVSISHDVLNDRPRMYCRVFLSCFIVHILVLMSEDAGSAGETLQNIGTILNCYSNDNKKVV